MVDDGSLPPADDDRRHPLVHRLRAPLSEDHAAIELEEALEALLDRLSLLLAEDRD